MTKQPTLTKADLIEEVLKVTELPRKESEIIVETIFDSIIEAIQKGETAGASYREESFCFRASPMVAVEEDLEVERYCAIS